MKKEIDKETKSELRDEYEFSKMKEGIRGKYAERFREGTNLVLLDSDVAMVFSDDETVNEALRSLMRLSQSTGTCR